MKVIFIFAHPDDESFSSGGTIAKLTKKGVVVKLITATKGEAGSMGNPPFTTRAELAKVRQQELANAAKILGISQIYFLHLIDGTLDKIPVRKIVEPILTILKKEKPDMVITFNKEGGSRHPDHIKVSKAATSAFKQYINITGKSVKLYYNVLPKTLLKIFDEKGLGYSTFGKIKGTPDTQITTIIDISDTIETKIRALKCHQTQKADWERFLKRMTVVNLRHEYFRLILENQLL